jgi:hypothetical protein
MDEEREHGLRALLLGEGGCRAVRDRGAADTSLFLRRGSLPYSIAVPASTWRAGAGRRNEVWASTVARIAAKRIAAPTPLRKAGSLVSSRRPLRRGAPEEPDRLHPELFHDHGRGRLGLVRDLQDLCLMACESDISWPLIRQAVPRALVVARLTSHPRPRRRRDCPRRAAGRSSRGRRRSRPRSRSGTPRGSPGNPSSW